MILHEELLKCNKCTQCAINKDYPFLSQKSECNLVYFCQLVSLHSNCVLVGSLMGVIFTSGINASKFDIFNVEVEFFILIM